MFIHEDFLLSSAASQRLYHEFAAGEPVLDYHTHLSPREILGNRQFANLHEIWLAGDHYKWRAMRANGVAEHYCTGGATAREKFLAWARTVPHTLGNPLYHWTHLELRRYFGIDTLLDERTAEGVWEETRRQLTGDPRLCVHGILDQFRVVALCTTDDPTSDLAAHRDIINAGELRTRVFPTYRPDRVLALEQPAAFNAWVDRLGAAASLEIRAWSDLLTALDRRHAEFHAVGCRISDHGLDVCPEPVPPESVAAETFRRVRDGQSVDRQQQRAYAAFLMFYFVQLDTKRGWTKQFHLGAARNNRTASLESLGPDAGFDSIGEWPQVAPLRSFFDFCDRHGGLPRTVVYNVHPAENYPIASLLGSFQGGSTPGKMQFGSGWWFLDQRDGMRAQLRTLANVGLLSRFVGMLTDSRSFMSFPRHEYFRRVLCEWLGQEMDAGRLPGDYTLIGEVVRRICFQNAANYFELPWSAAEVDHKPSEGRPMK